MLKTRRTYNREIIYTLLGKEEEVQAEIDRIFKDWSEKHPWLAEKEPQPDGNIFAIIRREA